MAYIDDPNLDEDDTNDGSGDSSASTGSKSTSTATGTSTPKAQTSDSSADEDALSTGASGVNSSSAGSSGATVAGSAGATPTQSGWTNLQNYLDVNQDQSAAMGNKIASNIDSQAQDAQSSLGSTVNDFNTNAVAPSLDTQQSAIDAAALDPTAYTDDASKYAQIQNDVAGTYNGPSSIQDSSAYSDAVGKYQSVADTLGLTQSEAGRMGLLQTNYARPDYNQGESQLDQLLIENSPQAQSALAGVNSRYSGMNTDINNAITASQATAAQKATQAQATAAYAKTAFDNSLASQQAAIAQKVTDANTTRTAQNDQAAALQTALQNKTLTAAQAQLLGLPTGAFYSPDDLRGAVTGTNNTIANNSSVSTAADATKMAALYKLANETNSYNFDNSQLGKFQQSTVGIDPKALANVVTQPQLQQQMDTTMIAPTGGQPSSISKVISDFKQQGVLDANGNVPPSVQVYLAQNPGATPNAYLPLILPYIQKMASLYQVSG